MYSNVLSSLKLSGDVIEECVDLLYFYINIVLYNMYIQTIIKRFSINIFLFFYRNI